MIMITMIKVMLKKDNIKNIKRYKKLYLLILKYIIISFTYIF